MLDAESTPTNVSLTVYVATQCSRYLPFSYYKNDRDNRDATSLNEVELMCPKA